MIWPKNRWNRPVVLYEPTTYTGTGVTRVFAHCFFSPSSTLPYCWYNILRIAINMHLKKNLFWLIDSALYILAQNKNHVCHVSELTMSKNTVTAMFPVYQVCTCSCKSRPAWPSAHSSIDTASSSAGVSSHTKTKTFYFNDWLFVGFT